MPQGTVLGVIRATVTTLKFAQQIWGWLRTPAIMMLGAMSGLRGGTARQEPESPGREGLNRLSTGGNCVSNAHERCLQEFGQQAR